MPTFEILLRKYWSSLRKLKIIFSNFSLEKNEILEKFFIRSFGWFKTNSSIFWWGLSHHKSWFWIRLVWLVSTKSHNKKAGFHIDKFEFEIRIGFFIGFVENATHEFENSSSDGKNPSGSKYAKVTQRTKDSQETVLIIYCYESLLMISVIRY